MATESFRGDFAALAAMMKASWSLNKETALLFSEEFLRAAFKYPASSFEMAPTIYSDEGIAGFCAAFPRNLQMAGRGLRLGVSTFLTVSSKLRGAGHGMALWGDAVERMRAAGCDGTINFCVEGDDMQRIMPEMAEFFRLNSRVVYKVQYLSRFLRPAAEKPVVTATDAEIELFLDLAKTCPANAPLVRTWTLAEANWQCRQKAGAISVSLEAEGRRGLLTGYIIRTTGNPPATVALMEDLFWGNLAPSEQGQLLQNFLSVAASRGAQSVSCPIMGYSSEAPLLMAGFRPSRRILHTWLTLWNGLTPEPLASLYTDVF